MANLSCGQWFCYIWCCVFYFSESAKGSDSEDDFLRQKTKAKAASDSDSDSDIGGKKGKRPSGQKYIFELKLAFLLHSCSLKFKVPLLYCPTENKSAADDLFGEADDISSDSDAEKPPTPGQPLVSICLSSRSLSVLLSLSCVDHPASLIVQSLFFFSSFFLWMFPNLFFSEPLAKPLWADPYYDGSMNHTFLFFLMFSFLLCACVQDTEDGMEGEQAEEEPAPETRIEVEIPKVSTDLGSDLYFVKLPNFLSVEPRSDPWHCQ